MKPMIGAALAALMLAGCATTQPVTVKGDTMCRGTRNISWSKADTPDTITQVRRHNARRAKVC